MSDNEWALQLVAQYAEDGEYLASFDHYGSEPVEHEEFAPRAFAALRGVLEIHAPLTNFGKVYCAACVPAVYPCATVKAIAEAIEGS